MSNVPKNPFAMVYASLWDMLLEHPGFERDVREGNRISFIEGKNRGPIKDSVQAADLPEVMLLSQGAATNLFSTSNSSKCTRQYSWVVASGDYRYYIDEKTPMLSTIEWYIFVAMHAWKQRLHSLTWAGKRFVTRCNTTAAGIGLSDPEKNRNIKGWSAAWSVEVEMNFDTRSLMAEMPTISPLPPES